MFGILSINSMNRFQVVSGSRWHVCRKMVPAGEEFFPRSSDSSAPKSHGKLTWQDSLKMTLVSGIWTHLQTGKIND